MTAALNANKTANINVKTAVCANVNINIHASKKQKSFTCICSLPAYQHADSPYDETLGSLEQDDGC